MNTLTIDRSLGRRIPALAMMLGLALPGGPARGQGPGAAPTEATGEEVPEGRLTPAERFKVLGEPETPEQKAARERARPPFEFYRTQVAPFDILPFVKPHHWGTLNLEMRANHADYEGWLQSAAVDLLGMPQEVVYRREVRILKGQTATLSLQILMPQIPRELSLELLRPGMVRPDDGTLAALRPLEPHQMLVLILAQNPNDYADWGGLWATRPTAGDQDPPAVERDRYYRVVIPQEATKPVLSPHPLTWTTISHVIWDGFDPTLLNPAQMQALLDWLHWGGQLVIVGGAGPWFAPLQDSPLGPFLPADVAGENRLLDQDDLAPLSNAYPPPRPIETYRDFDDEIPPRYDPPAPITPADNRPVYLAGLRPREDVGAVPIPLGDRADVLLGVERRVGRGRILMLGLSPLDPAIRAWKGRDTLVRRLLLRRPEEPLTVSETQVVGRMMMGGPTGMGAQTLVQRDYRTDPLGGPDLTWVRYLDRDLGAPSRTGPHQDLTAPPTAMQVAPPGSAKAARYGGRRVGPAPPSQEPRPPRTPVAEWNDDAALPRLYREALEKASGITIPGSGFILKVILTYLIALVPLNYLICRFVLRRREWAWAVVPLLALGFAIGVERLAAYDLGFDSACDEIALLETYGDYPRGYLSRFAAIYSTGRVRYTIRFPDNPAALALPMATGRELRGEDVTQSTWQSLPVPALVGLPVQPRSLAMYRAEQMVNLPGTVELVEENGSRRVVNRSGLDLHDAVLVDDGSGRGTYLGSISADGEAILTPGSGPSRSGPATSWTDPRALLGPLMNYRWEHPEDRGEIRLVAWADRGLPGQELDPAVDRHRGLTLVVAHLRMGPPPAPDGERFNAAAVAVRTPGSAGASPSDVPEVFLIPSDFPVESSTSRMIRRGAVLGPGRAPPIRTSPRSSLGTVQPPTKD